MTNDVNSFFTFNLLRVVCLTIIWSYIDIGLVLLEIWKGVQIKNEINLFNTEKYHHLRNVSGLVAFGHCCGYYTMSVSICIEG